MAIVIPNESERALLDKLLRLSDSSSVKSTVRLYQNDPTLNESTVLGDFTQADFSGYLEQDITYLEWNPPSTSGGTTSIVAASKSFVHNGGVIANTIYGYYVISYLGGDKLVWCERFTSSKVMATNVDSIVIIARLQAE